MASEMMASDMQAGLYLPDQLPAQYKQVLSNFIRMYEVPEHNLQSIVGELYLADGTFSDPLMVIHGKESIWRQFAALRKLFSIIKVTPTLVNISKGTNNTVQLCIDNIQTYGNQPLKVWPLNILSYVLPSTISLHATSTLLLTVPRAATTAVAATGSRSTEDSTTETTKVQLHQDEWHNLPLPPSFLRQLNGSVVDLALAMIMHKPKAL